VLRLSSWLIRSSTMEVRWRAVGSDYCEASVQVFFQPIPKAPTLEGRKTNLPKRVYTDAFVSLSAVFYSLSNRLCLISFRSYRQNSRFHTFISWGSGPATQIYVIS
jgi:hypothetical protein